jgi:hypothetical protein
VRSALVTALVSCAERPGKAKVRRFVHGLSSDELQFIAGFLGACVLDSPSQPCTCRAQWAERIATYKDGWADGPESRATGRGTSDRDHKMILLLEFLCRIGGPAAIEQSNCPRVARV